MNKFYIKIFFFLISIFVYVNNTSFATELDSPDDSLEHSLKMGIFMKNNNLITEPASDIDFLVKSNISQIDLIKTVKNNVTPDKEYLDYITQDKDYLDNLIPNKEYLDYITQDKDYLDNLIPNKEYLDYITQDKDYLDNLIPNKEYLDYITQDKDYLDNLIPNKEYLDYITQDKDYLDNLIPNKEYLDYINQDKDYLDNLIPNKDAQEFENHENRDLLSCTDYEEAKKASEIMCDCNQIVKMLYEPKDLYGFGSNDSKVLFIPRIVLKHNSNLVLIQKYSVTPFHKYNFGLFTIAEESNTTFFANTSININDETSANKKKGKKGVNLLNDHIDFDDIIRQIVLKNMFANFFGFIITKEYDHVGVTYVESNRHDKSYPKNYDKIKRRAQNMLNLMNILLYGFKG
ncbi:fam-a protein [Plasmodium berghei ANKA]|uniref:Fam-a protein n=2 Tax=Plasmodium berghei TaxID=5821 RepID=A0A509AWJ2_PLABA|nr:fam-a protein [Plasmodium berghei ANKA]VUC58778.1 fam-a protein [Plasmodium berghei ANKA]|eukprot:XP_034424501.1 fam-a protein [Plasmodium berghei ANKA]